MIVRLSLEDFLFFKGVELYFDKGMNVITGETGTGKSLTLSSFLFLMGQEGDYEEGTSVELELYLDGEEYILRREVQRGRSRYYLNGRSSTRATLRQILSSALLIQGQNDRLKILKSDFQRDLYDRFAGCIPLRQECERLYQKATELENRLKEWHQRRLEREVRIRVLQEQIREIEGVGLLPEEYQTLRKRLEELSKAEKINSLVYEGMALIGSEGGIKERLNRLSRLLSELSALTGKPMGLEEVYEKLLELERELKSLRVDYSREELDRLNEKLYKVQSLERKYRMSYGELYGYMLRLREELGKLLEQEESIEEIEDALRKVKEKLEEAYKKLTNARLSKKEEFENRVKENLRDMGLEHASFVVGFEEKEGRYGREQIRFLFSSYGSDPKPIEDVASGGEISRLSLALFMLSPPAETYLLDEVDAGISGHTSVKLARLLKRLSKSTQLIVITHLPAVASVADKHFTTKKVLKGGKPCITVEELKENRLEEIARLMGVVNEKTLMGAKALIEELEGV